MHLQQVQRHQPAVAAGVCQRDEPGAEYQPIPAHDGQPRRAPDRLVARLLPARADPDPHLHRAAGPSRGPGGAQTLPRRPAATHAMPVALETRTVGTVRQNRAAASAPPARHRKAPSAGDSRCRRAARPPPSGVSAGAPCMGTAGTIRLHQPHAAAAARLGPRLRGVRARAQPVCACPMVCGPCCRRPTASCGTRG